MGDDVLWAMHWEEYAETEEFAGRSGHRLAVGGQDRRVACLDRLMYDSKPVQVRGNLRKACRATPPGAAPEEVSLSVK